MRRLCFLVLLLALASTSAVVEPARARTVPPQPVLPARPAPRPALGTRVARYARHLLGVRYAYGGSSPRSGFDCSGLVRYVYGHFGISLAHSSFAQFSRGRRISRRGLKPGDLVFFAGAGHVGIYVGHGRFIEAPHSGAVVRISTLAGWYRSSYAGARRLHPA